MSAAQRYHHPQGDSTQDNHTGQQVASTAMHIQQQHDVDIDPNDPSGTAPELSEAGYEYTARGQPHPSAAPASSNLPTVLKKLQKWGDYKSYGDVVQPTRFIPCKTPLSLEILSHWSLPEAPKHRLTVPELIAAQKAKGRNVALILDLSNHDCLYSCDLPDGVQYTHVRLVAKELPPPDFVAEVCEVAQGFWSRHPDAYIAIHCAYGFNRTGFVVCCWLIEKCGLTVDAALASFGTARPPGVKHEAFKAELRARYEPVPLAGPSPTSTLHFDSHTPDGPASRNQHTQGSEVVSVHAEELPDRQQAGKQVVGGPQSAAAEQNGIGIAQEGGGDSAGECSPRASIERQDTSASQQSFTDSQAGDAGGASALIGSPRGSSPQQARVFRTSCEQAEHTPSDVQQLGVTPMSENDSLGFNDRVAIEQLRARRTQAWASMEPSQLEGRLVAGSNSPAVSASPRAPLARKSISDVDWPAPEGAGCENVALGEEQLVRQLKLS